MARHAVINNETFKVVNVVIWEGQEWFPPKNHFIIQNDLVDIGDIYNKKTNTFTKTNLSKADNE